MVTRTLYIPFLIGVILFKSLALKAQTNKERQANFAGCWTGFDVSTGWYADTLNFIQKPAELPAFLNDYLIDWKGRDQLNNCLLDKSEKISFRVAILARVHREDVLEWIITSKNANYDKLYIPEELQKNPVLVSYNSFPLLPFMKYSLRELAKMRLEEIKKIRKALNKRN